jgi:sulfate-transporting ATPase
MTNAFQFALLGLGAGAVYAMLAQGIVVIFRGSGVINLAQGAEAMLAAYIFHSLRANEHWSLGAAMALSVALGAAIGVATDVLVLRRLRTSSPLTRLIATLGVLVIIQSIAIIQWGSSYPVFVSPIFHSSPVHFFGLVVPSDRLWLLLVAVVITLVLTIVWRYTRAGWITEAVSENERAASSLGWSPQVVSAVTWGVGAGLAAFAGIIVTPITQLDVNNLVLLVIPALAAALIGGFRSYTLTLLGGILLGVLQSLVSYYENQSWWPSWMRTGMADAIPLIVLIVVLVVRGSALPLRGHVFDRLPRVGSGKVNWGSVVGLTGAMILALSLISNTNVLAALAATFAIATLLLSLVVLTGYAGQISLAQTVMAGIAALIAARLFASAGLPWVLAAFIATVSTSVAGLLFAIPALRSRGVNLAVTTLALGLAVQAVVFNNPKFSGSTDGIPVPAPHFFGINVDPYHHAGRYGILCLLVFVACGVVVASLRRGRIGRKMLAVRGNERAAASLGIDVIGTKLHAFAIAGALAGLGGILIAFSAPAVTMFAFGPITSIYAVANAVIGGIGYIAGALFGALLDPSSVGSLIALYWQNASQWLPVLGGVGLLLILILDPDGLVALHLKGAHAEVKSKAQYLRPEVAFVAAAGGTRARLAKRIPRLAPKPPTDPLARAAGVTRIVRVPAKTLRIEDVTVRYGGVVAADRISLTVRPGEIVGLIGPNGAGKTSLIDGISGFTRMASGSVFLDDVPVHRWPAYRRARGGMARSWQGLELFLDMSLLENLQTATDTQDTASMLSHTFRPGRSTLTPAALAAIDEFGFRSVLDRTPEEMSYGQRRLLAIARAVAAEPSVLLLDEPVAGLDDEASAEFARLVRKLADEWGLAVLVVEHDMNFVMRLCDRLVVLDFGRQIAAGTPAEVARDPAAIAAYLGTETVETAMPAPA